MFSDAVILEHSDDTHTEENITEKDLEEPCLRTISSYISELVAFTWWHTGESGEIEQKKSKLNTHQFYQKPNQLSSVVKRIVHQT